MKSNKKCPHCGQWSGWNQNPADRCEHCQHVLDPVAVAHQQARQERRQKEAIDFIKINPDEPWFTRFYKRMGLGFQIAFVSIISFILWLIALLAG